MRRRVVPWVALLVAFALAAAACGGDGGDDSAGSGTTTGDGTTPELPECPIAALEQWDPAADGRIEVVLWHSLVAKTRDVLVAMAEDYNASQDKVTVRIESQGQSYEELLRKYTEAIPTDDLPAIALLEDTNTQFIADSGTVLPGQACFEASGVSLDDFLPVAVDYYTVDGAFLPVGLNPSTNLLYYNRSHFEEAGLDPDDPPGTLAEVQAAAQAIQDAGVVDEPFVLQLQPWFVEHWLTGVGASIVDNDNGRGPDGATAGAFDNESAAELFTWLQGMDDAGLLNGVPGIEGQVEHYFAIALGQSSMTIETSTAATSISAFLEGDLDTGEFGVDDPSGVTSDLEIDAAPMPGLEGPGQVQLGGGVWYLTNTTPPEVQAAAWDFARWFDEPAQQVRWNLEGSYLPWNMAAADDPTLVESWETTTTGRWLSTAYQQLLDADPDWPGPLIGPYTETRTAVRDALDAMLLSGTDPSSAIATADEEITTAIADYNDENF
jgi:sn-glycerol 3-phosphate transport system substrate-binding protein